MWHTVYTFDEIKAKMNPADSNFNNMVFVRLYSNEANRGMKMQLLC